MLVVVSISTPVFAYELTNFTLHDPDLSIRLVAELACIQGAATGHTVLADGSVLLLSLVDFNDQYRTRVMSALHDDGTITPIVTFRGEVYDPNSSSNPWNCCNIDSIPTDGELVLIASRPPDDPSCPRLTLKVFKISGLPSLRLPGPPR